MAAAAANFFLPPPCRSRSPNECNLQGKRLSFLFVRSLCYPTLIPRIRSAVTKIPFFPSFFPSFSPLSSTSPLGIADDVHTTQDGIAGLPALQFFFFSSSVAYCPLSFFVMKENDLLLLTHKHEYVNCRDGLTLQSVGPPVLPWGKMVCEEGAKDMACGRHFLCLFVERAQNGISVR